MKNSKFINLIVPIMLIFGIQIAHSQKIKYDSIVSPNKKIKVKIGFAAGKGKLDFGPAEFSVAYSQSDKYECLLQSSTLGIRTTDQIFASNLKLIVAGKPKIIQSSYQMITGKRRNCVNHGIEKEFKFKNRNEKTISIIFRVYNDGVAFSYVLPGSAGEMINVTDEYTSFHVPDSTARWTQPYTSSYEGFYDYSTDGKGFKNQQWGFPALFSNNRLGNWILLSESGNTAFSCGARLDNSEKLNQYKIIYSDKRSDFNQVGVVAPAPWKSPWRVIIAGKLNDIVSSTLITDVSQSNQLDQTDWIIPGAVSWIYWANNHGSKDYKKVVEYIDLAKNMGWPYVLIDWEWDVMSNGGNLEDAIRYAKSKGIKPLLWYNSGTTKWSTSTPLDKVKTHEKREREFQWLNEIGVYGVKIDFFAGDQQDMMRLYLDILKDAAKHHLMVDFHGATIPRGWSRTYPNLMTVEAVYGAEWYNNKDVLTKKAASHNTTLPFTRNVIGSMDYTPVTFSNSQHEHITTYGHELALSVVFESGLQHFADKPEAYESLPEAPKSFLKSVPTAWDETRLLDGFPGKSVIVARRKGSIWYVAGLNGLDIEQTFSLSAKNIGDFGAKLYLIQDGVNDKSFNTTTINNDGTISIKCLPRGGFAGYFISR